MNNFVVKWHQIVLIIVHFVIDSIDLWRKENRCGESNESRELKKMKALLKREIKKATMSKRWTKEWNNREELVIQTLSPLLVYSLFNDYEKKREVHSKYNIQRRRTVFPLFCFYLCFFVFAYKYLWTLRLRLH